MLRDLKNDVEGEGWTLVLFCRVILGGLYLLEEIWVNIYFFCFRVDSNEG